MEIAPDLVAEGAGGVDVARQTLEVLVGRDQLFGLERIQHLVVALLTEVARDVDVVVDPCALHFQEALGLVAVPLVCRLGNDPGREDDLVAVVEVIVGLAATHSREERSWLALMARHDWQEVLLAVFHDAVEALVDGASMTVHLDVVRKVDVEMRCGPGVFLHRTPQQDRFAANLLSEFEEAGDTGDVACEGSRNHAAVVIFETEHGVVELFSGNRLGRCPTLPVGVRTVFEITENTLALAADLTEPFHVERITEHWVVVDTFVKPVDNGSFRGVEDRVDGVNRRVGDVDELHFSLVADPHRLAGVHDLQVILDVELVLVADLFADEFDGEWGRNDGGVVAVGEFGDRADVVEVAVGRDDGLDLAVEFAHHAVVGDRAHIDEIQTVHALSLDVVVNQYLREVQAHIEDDDVIVHTDCRHLSTNLFVAANCRNFYFHRCSERELVHGDGEESRQPRRRSTTARHRPGDPIRRPVVYGNSALVIPIADPET